MPQAKSYAHDAHGINVTNLRSIAQNSGGINLAGLPPIALDLLRPGGGGGAGGAGSAAAGAFSDGGPELLSARLRHGAALVRAAAAQQVECQLRGVEGAIQTKLAKTRDLVEALQGAARVVDAELAAAARCAARLRSAEAHLASQLGLNRARQQVRSKRSNTSRPPTAAAAAGGCATARSGGRPSSAAVADEAARRLHHQALLLDGAAAKAARCAALVDAAAARLGECRARVAADLRARGQALSIDEAMLGLHGGGGSAIAAAPAATAASGVAERHGPGPGPGGRGGGGETAAVAPPAWAAAGSPGARRKWEGDTAALLAGAHELVAESGRLRKKVKAALLELSATTVGSARAVNESLAERIQDARRARAALQARLRAVEAEAARAAGERASLRRSIEGNAAPLEQLRARFHMRRRRPGGEHVRDEIESALAAEAAGLAAVARQLQRYEAAVGEQVEQLRATADALRPTIDSCAAVEEVEELAARLDGREQLDSPRAPSIISVCASTVVSGYSTLGDSASQVCGPTTRRNLPRTQNSILHAARRPSAAGGRGPPGESQVCGRAAPSEAASGASSGAVRGAVARIAALERELAEARAQTCALEGELRAAQQGRPGRQGREPGTNPTSAAGGQQIQGQAASAAGVRPGSVAGERSGADSAGAGGPGRPMTAAAVAQRLGQGRP